MNKIKFPLILVLVFNFLELLGQTQSPNQFNIAPSSYSPPAPEASALGKFGQIPVNFSTGAATFSVDLFTIMTRTLKFPITASYASNGVNMNSIASRIGMDWVLNGGGVITKKVMDKNDDTSNPWFIPDNTSDPKALYPFFINSGLYDHQVDEYYYHFNGMDGSFFQQSANKTIRQENATNIKIIRNSLLNNSAWDFKITTTDGVAYYFGGVNATEASSLSANCLFSETNNADDITGDSYYLNKIVSADGDSIIFKYSPISYSYIAFNSYIKYRPNYLDVSCWGPTYTGNNGCPFPVIDDKQCASTMLVNGPSVLKEIDYNVKEKIKFYSSPRTDLSGDYKYDSLQVVNQDGSTLKKWIFNYNYPNNRLYLSSLYEKDSAVVNNPYYFSYNSPESLGVRLTLSQDHSGYFNGKGNSDLIPTFSPSYSPVFGYSAVANSAFANGANREPDSTLATLGLLTSITYPTGAKSVFDWESNSHWFSGYTRNPVTIRLSGAGTSPDIQQTSESSIFTVDSSQTILLSGSCCTIIPPNPVPVYYSEIGSQIFIISTVDGSSVPLYFLNNSHNSMAVNPGLKTATLNADIKAGNSYKLRIVSTGSLANTTATINYFGIKVQTNTNLVDCGSRIKRISTLDKNLTSTGIRRFRYNDINHLLLPGNVNLQKLGYFDYTRIYTSAAPVMGAENYWGYYVAYSQNQFPFSSSTSNNIYYPYVTELIGETGSLGAIQHHFIVQKDNQAQNFFNTPIFNTPLTNSSPLNGLEDETQTFKFMNGLFQLVEKQNMFYSTDISGSFTQPNYTVQVVYTPTIPFYTTAGMKYFHATEFFRKTYWKHLDSVVSTEYMSGGQNSKTSRFVYGDTLYLNKTAESYINSKGILLTTQYLHPHEMIRSNLDPTGVYQKMINSNRVTDITRTTNYSNNTELATSLTTYRDWFSNSTVIAPEYVLFRSLPTSILENRVQYFSYGLNGKPTELAKYLGIHSSYIWSFDGRYIIASCTGAVSGQIAFTSFENNDNGNWHYDSKQCLKLANANTGLYLCALNGLITSNPLPAGSYTVSYWADRPCSVNGTTPVSVGLRNATGSSLYTHSIFLAAGNRLSVSGNGNLIDDLRLLPSQSLMTSYTYVPNVGITSITGPSGDIVFYNYDSIGRLNLKSDIHKSIHNQFLYHYYGL